MQIMPIQESARPFKKRRFQEVDLYCVCKKPYKEGQFMIACDYCEEWYHPSCLGLTEQYCEYWLETHKQWYCDKCKANGSVNVALLPPHSGTGKSTRANPANIPRKKKPLLARPQPKHVDEEDEDWCMEDHPMERTAETTTPKQRKQAKKLKREKHLLSGSVERRSRDELRKLCKEMGLKVRGTKAELVQRLQEYKTTYLEDGSSSPPTNQKKSRRKPNSNGTATHRSARKKKRNHTLSNFNRASPKSHFVHTTNAASESQSTKSQRRKSISVPVRSYARDLSELPEHTKKRHSIGSSPSYSSAPPPQLQSRGQSKKKEKTSTVKVEEDEEMESKENEKKGKEEAGLVEFLRAVRLERLAPIFAENEIQAEDLPLLTNSDLMEMNIKVGPKRRILHALANQQSGKRKRVAAKRRHSKRRRKGEEND